MKIVIDIPKQVYDYIRRYEHIANGDVLNIKDAIINGTPLSEEIATLAEMNKSAYSQGYIDGVKSINICPYCGEYIGEEE